MAFIRCERMKRQRRGLRRAMVRVRRHIASDTPPERGLADRGPALAVASIAAEAVLGSRGARA
jgi:hypothetical protein